ncbi:MAG TPA: serine protease [Solirubrobacterales bacterium]|nr:serine protease [Solirubrobacterales bacterium]
MSPASPRGRGVATLLAALALLGSLVLVAAATAAPRPGGKAGAADPTATASVIGGHNVTIAQYPALAYIEGVQATSGYACTGTVVAPRVVLTAGHCVEDIESSSIVEPGAIAVATGVSNLRHIPHTQVSQVVQVLAYPHFDPTELHGDAGLLILAQPVSAPPIALAGAADAALNEPGDELTIAGWGIDDRTTEHAPDQLQAAVVPIESASRCRRGTRRFYPFFEPTGQLCALDAPHFKVTSCHGDSGGPAIATRADGTMVEVGVTSLGDGTCNPTSPAIFTRIDQISAWVQSWIDAVESGGPAPRVVIPKSHIPLLTRERAEELSALALFEALGPRFGHAQEPTFRCDRQSKARVRCNVTWYQGANDYFGTTTVFFAIRHNVVLAGAHLTVHWVNDHCYFHSGHPQRCRVQTKRN